MSAWYLDWLPCWIFPVPEATLKPLQRYVWSKVALRLLVTFTMVVWS